MERWIKATVGIAVVLTFLMAVPSPADIQIAYIHNDIKNVDYLAGYGYSVTYLKNPTGLTLNDLSGFQAVLVTPAVKFTEPATIGNVLADFADAGGGVVLSGLSWQGQWALGGRIMSNGYSAFTADPSNTGYGISASSLGTIYDGDHPIFEGVNTGNVPTYWQTNVGMNADGILLADWPSGRHALAYTPLSSAAVNVVATTLLPVTYSSYQMMTPDSERLVANALDFSISGSPAVTPLPGAVLLGTLGVGFGGWVLRKRRDL